MSTAIEQRPLSADQVLRIANEDAIRAYGDVSEYRISIRLHPDGWHVEYDLVDPNMQGGGPQYVIGRDDGAILSKKYYQ